MTTIRALTVVVIVVVLIFTAGSLVTGGTLAAAISSTPQPQNLICTHSGNNATCSQGGIIPTTTQIPLPTPTQPSATLTIIKHVINDIVGTIFAKDFTSSISGTNVSPQRSFPGVTTTVTLKPGTFPVALLQQANATTTAVPDHNKCSSGDDIVNCMHNKETHLSAKDTTTPFVLPIPFP